MTEVRITCVSLLLALVCFGATEATGQAVAGESCCPAISDEAWSRDTLAPGVVWHSGHFESVFGRPQQINIIELVAGVDSVQLEVTAAVLHGRESMTTSALGALEDALFAVNGGFAHGGPNSSNSGLIKIDGVVLPHLREEPPELRFVGSGALGIDDTGIVRFRARDGDAWEDEWPEVPTALAGGHLLLMDGQMLPDIAGERFVSDREARHSGRAHPRTAICTTADGSTLLVAIDGRHDGTAEGLTLRELATFLASQACAEALNLDGGGSTTMWIDGRGVVNHPSDNGRFDREGERAIRSAIVGRHVSPDVN